MNATASPSARRPSQRRQTRRLMLALLVCGFLLSRPALRAAPSTGAPQAAAPFAPFLEIVPAPDGGELYIQASSPFSGNATVLIDEGSTGHKGGWTMAYSDTIQTYIGQATGFTPGAGSSGSLKITTSTNLESAAVAYERAYIPAGTTDTLSSNDGLFQLNIISPNTFPAATYTVIVPSFAPPGPAPAGYQIVGFVYSAHESGAKPETDQPMTLRMYYDSSKLAGIDPHLLTIMRWNPDQEHKGWEPVGGHLIAAQHYLSAAVSQFGAYALMAGTAWHDDFDDTTGLDLASSAHVVPQQQGSRRVLGLDITPGSGSATSLLITPTLALGGWGTLVYTATVNSPATSLSVDIVSAAGVVLLSDVHSGASLTSIDPALYPSLRLRARLVSAAAGQTPTLDSWHLSWRATGGRWRIYLPMAARAP